MIGIYKIESPSGKIYIGQSWDCIKRMAIYKRCACKKQRKLYASFVKYGFINHTVSFVCVYNNEITQNILDNSECFYINLYKNLGFEMLNIKEGGSSGKHSQETKDILRLAKTGKKHKEETKEKLREIRKNQIFTQESREKQRIANTGRKFSKEFGEAVSKRMLGKKLTKETKNKLSIINKKPILQFTLEGILIKKWDSCKDASINLGISESAIGRSARGQRNQAKGFKFKYEAELLIIE
jgi:group I intron endonuclease